MAFRSSNLELQIKRLLFDKQEYAQSLHIPMHILEHIRIQEVADDLTGRFIYNLSTFLASKTTYKTRNVQTIYVPVTWYDHWKETWPAWMKRYVTINHEPIVTKIVTEITGIYPNIRVPEVIGDKFELDFIRHFDL